MCPKRKGLSLPSSQSVGVATPDESVLVFVEGELRASGRLGGLSALAYLRRFEKRRVTPQEKAALLLALAMYGERVDPSAHALIRATLG
jgi:hypothetical protein